MTPGPLTVGPDREPHLGERVPGLGNAAEARGEPVGPLLRQQAQHDPPEDRAAGEAGTNHHDISEVLVVGDQLVAGEPEPAAEDGREPDQPEQSDEAVGDDGRHGRGPPPGRVLGDDDGLHEVAADGPREECVVERPPPGRGGTHSRL